MSNDTFSQDMRTQGNMWVFRAIADHDAADPDLLTLQAGQRLRFERRVTEWEGWLWCTDESGKKGWVPEAWLTLDGHFAILHRDYFSRELSVQTGARVMGSLIESGWLWATTETGVPEWVPLNVLAECTGGRAT